MLEYDTMGVWSSLLAMRFGLQHRTLVCNVRGEGNSGHFTTMSSRNSGRLATA